MSLQSSSPPTYSTDLCGICRDPLQIPSTEDTGPSSIIDDVELRCGTPGAGPSGHHFHWSCMIEWVQNGGDRSQCPLCRQNTLDRQGRFIVDVRNEGGFTGGIDFGEEIDEEIYMDEHPEERYREAFLICMANHDFEEAERLLKEHNVDVNCRYQQGNASALHMAAINDDAESIRFLLAHGADRNVVDDRGTTPLAWAEAQQKQQAVAALLED